MSGLPGKEKDRTCQLLLALRLTGSGCHLIPDIFARFTELQQDDDPSRRLMQSGLTVEQQAVSLEALHLSDVAPCWLHGRWCPCERVDLEVTGTPCQDYSPMGLRRGINGVNYPIFRAWVLHCLKRRPKIIVHENVGAFPVGLLHDAFGERYRL